jgi:hypothetical protein
MKLILFALATIGLSNILVHGKILDVIKIFGKSIRQWMQSLKFLEELLSCYECTGFWSGLIIGSMFFDKSRWYEIFLYGFSGSVLSQFYSELIYLLRSKTDFVVEDSDDNEKS